MERLQKVLARAGVASRRKCEEMILQGRVRVNGQVVTQLGTRVDPAQDTISLATMLCRSRRRRDNVQSSFDF
jgi:16S rRNA U516 pseudouridylate synthase RsuA-like enzyme